MSGKERKKSMEDLEEFAKDVGIDGLRCLKWERRKSFIERLITAIDSLPANRWNKLNSDTQAFFNHKAKTF